MPERPSSGDLFANRRAPPASHRRDIDGLRAIAIIPVILFHAHVAPFSGGFLGVDVFFVVSGFLITSLIGPEIAQRRFSYVSFWERRARRCRASRQLGQNGFAKKGDFHCSDCLG